MAIEIIKIEEKKVSGQSVLLTRSQAENYRIISTHWIYFNKKLGSVKRNSGSNWEKYGLTYKSEGNYFYMPAVLSVSIPEETDFEMHTIMKGKYTKFQHKGDMKNLKTTIYEIYKIILPVSDLKLDTERTLLHFEKYDYRFNWNKADSIIDIFVPIAN